MRRKSSEHSFLEATLAQATIIKIEEALKKIKEDEYIDVRKQIIELYNMYNAPSGINHEKDEIRTMAEVLRVAQVSENILRRIKSDKGYAGPDTEGCIRICLAIGCSTLEDFDLLLSVRGFETLTFGISRKYAKYRQIVKCILLQAELPPEDRVSIFAEYSKECN